MSTVLRAEPRTTGTHFLTADADCRDCKPSCYRIGRHGITLLCDVGHSAGFHDGRTGFAGSAFAASLNSLPVDAPFIVTP